MTTQRKAQSMILHVPGRKPAAVAELTRTHLVVDGPIGRAAPCDATITISVDGVAKTKQIRLPGGITGRRIEWQRPGEQQPQTGEQPAEKVLLQKLSQKLSLPAKFQPIAEDCEIAWHGYAPGDGDFAPGGSREGELWGNRGTTTKLVDWTADWDRFFSASKGCNVSRQASDE